MSMHSLDKLPWDADRLNLKKDAQATLTAYKAFLKDPAFEHRIDVKVLVQIAANDGMPLRERLRASEMLAKMRMKAMAQVAELTCVKEQVLDQLNLKDANQQVNLTQVNQTIEIVRQDDWRAATAEIRDATTDGDDA